MNQDSFSRRDDLLRASPKPAPLCRAKRYHTVLAASVNCKSCHVLPSNIYREDAMPKAPADALKSQRRG
jgi:hypothetical protein